ncbi:flavin reductase family protein [Pseudochrobactrum sp. sp1633]|uniref:flavin reductase family protein n=1 Tax=Pseudochrobactrum sp. sp1633 TaxID=3036706 RepID=UPI0025A5B2B3|nr:flavin reductase family protein [Pseudochrobactrum sp. sp1633]MDM8346726.1 flavin reductase family protein [Pseudochrobactrum sp. sp1633]HWD13362.1 flavin reductase family protein [Pseudochrobactrum sp.]
MFYEPQNGHGLPHNPLKAIISPRPVGWIGTRSKEGALNLAPYSFFNIVCDTPPLLMFSSSGYKDSVAFVEETREFTANMVGGHLAEQMNATSVNAPRGTSEFDYAGLTPVSCEKIKAPRVAEAYASLECVAVDIRQLTGRDGKPTDSYMVIGEVVGVHIDEYILVDGLIDITRSRPVSRLGYMDFATTDTVYELFRPKWGE